jgi:hypothetical protein
VPITGDGRYNYGFNMVGTAERGEASGRNRRQAEGRGERPGRRQRAFASAVPRRVQAEAGRLALAVLALAVLAGGGGADCVRGTRKAATMVLKKETHDDRFRRYARRAIVLGVIASLCWTRAHRPFSVIVVVLFAGGILGGLTFAIMSAGSYVLHVLEKRKRNDA